jgi:hypothetical protein
MSDAVGIDKFDYRPEAAPEGGEGEKEPEDAHFDRRTMRNSSRKTDHELVNIVSVSKDRKGCGIQAIDIVSRSPCGFSITSRAPGVCLSYFDCSIRALCY